MKMPRRQERAEKARTGGSHARGFTLIEMAVTLVIIGLIFAFAVPSFRTMVISNRLTTAANDVVDAINIARVEAIKRNGNVQFCSNSASANTTNDSDTLGAQCGSDAGAVVGLSVDSSGNAVVDPVRAAFVGITTPLKISGDMTALRFNGQGMGTQVGGNGAPYSGVVIDICSKNLSANQHRTIRLEAGSIVQVEVTSEECT